MITVSIKLMNDIGSSVNVVYCITVNPSIIMLNPNRCNCVINSVPNKQHGRESHVSASCPLLP